MITLTAKINLLSGDNKALSLGSTNLLGNNISSDLGAILGVKKDSRNPFIIGASKIGDGSTFSNGIDYFIGNELSDNNGNFATSYEITIKGDSMSSLTIAFDTTNKRHPKKIYINDVEYVDDDAIFTVADLKESTTHTIRIVDWNDQKYPLVITGIYAEVSIEINEKNITGISRSIFDRSNIKLPSYGIVSNIGDIEFNDLDNEIRDYAEQLLLKKGLKCEIKLNNTLVHGASETIGIFETNEWNYDSDNRAVSVSLKDDLEEWQDIEVEKIPLLERNSMIEIYYQLLERTPSKWKNSNNEFELDDETYRFISKITCNYPYLESGNLWQQWTKFCEVCALHIYKNNVDKVVVKHLI